jgi:hypothetical protein
MELKKYDEILEMYQGNRYQANQYWYAQLERKWPFLDLTDEYNEVQDNLK